PRLHTRRGGELRRADRPRLDGRVPRSRRSAPRGQGLHRAGRGHHQLPLRDMKTVLVCEARVPFVHGGAEFLVRSLVTELTRRGYKADRASVPFKWYPKDELQAQAAAWRMIVLSESNGEPIDTVI